MVIFEWLSKIFEMILGIEPDGELKTIFDAILGLFAGI
jgi:hypothetical protein